VRTLQHEVRPQRDRRRERIHGTDDERVAERRLSIRPAAVRIETTWVDEVNVDVEHSSGMRYRRGVQAAGGDVERHLPTGGRSRGSGRRVLLAASALSRWRSAREPGKLLTAMLEAVDDQVWGHRE
jgi:hypothetical protein